MNLQGKPFYLSKVQEEWVRHTLTGMTAEEKIGQLFVVLGPAYGDEELKQLIKQHHIGGVLYRPMPAAALKEIWKQLDSNANIPLLKAANLEEGGYGANSEGTYFGSQMQVAAANDLTQTERFAKVCAVEGRAAGCNWNFAPVCDIDVNFQNPITNVRTYGSDPEKVRQNVESYVKTLQSCGMAAACKHFPGDGVDFRDQHLHPTYNSLPADQWYATYGKIYQTAIEAGLLSVMVGHIVQPAVEMEQNPALTFADCLPASQSKELLTGVLREKFGFNGVVITDATIMGGYCMSMERCKALPATLMAGCDMFCFTPDIYEDLDILHEALQTGELTEDRLDEAVTRILALKRKLEDMSETLPEIHAAAWKAECADRAATLVKDTQKLIPVQAEKYPKVKLVCIGEDTLPEGGSMVEYTTHYLKEKGFSVERYDPMADDLHGSKNLPKDRLTLMLVNLPTASNQTTVRINWCKKHALDTPRFVHEEAIAMISLNNPYHLQDAPRVPTYINAYSPTWDALKASLDKLLGESTFTGVSPVDAFCGLPDAQL